MPSVLIIGAGSRVGQDTANKFADAGYQVATASRTTKADSKHKHFVFDASKPEDVTGLFDQIRKAVGTPSVVIHNGKVPFTVLSHNYPASAS
jgi:NAD(P)-dependent dehydrogenase (short-subunit alcohol dehydrogenase family)